MAGVELPALGTHRVFWVGAHAFQNVSGRPLQSPVGKLHSEGLSLLKSYGWERVSQDDPRTPCFAWTTRKGADFPTAAVAPGLPAVRQFPQRCTAVLDDKALMAQCLQAEGCASLMPRTWTSIDAFVRDHAGGGSGVGPAAAQPEAEGAAAGAEGARPLAADCSGLWFLKHRHGVKGQAVYPFVSLPALLARLAAISGAHNRRQFVIQEGVAPPLLLRDGRKFTLRAHVLVVLDQGQPAGQQQQQQQQQQQAEQQQKGQQQGQQLGQQLGQPAEQQGPPHEPRQLGQLVPCLQGQLQHAKPVLRAYVHEDVIVQEHARPLQPQTVAAAISPAAVDTKAAAAAATTLVAAAPQPAAAAAEATAAEGATEGTAMSAAAVAGAGGRRQAANAAPVATAAQQHGGLADPSVHVSSKGRGHPCPYLLSQLSEQQENQQTVQQHVQQHAEHQHSAGAARAAATATACSEEVWEALQRELWAQVCSVSAATMAAAGLRGLVPADADPRATFYHVFAFDFAVAARKAAGAAEAAAGAEAAQGGQPAGAARRQRPRVLLLEANSYCAIASGTMRAVPKRVYTRLVGDVLRLVVLPALPGGPDGVPAPAPEMGGFHCILG